MKCFASVAGFIGAALMAVAATSAQASYVQTVIDFEQGLDTSLALFDPLLAEGDFLLQAGHAIGGFSIPSAPGSFVGSLVDGANAEATCQGIRCPRSSGRYLAALNGAALELSRTDSSLFRLESFESAFVAAIPSTVPGIPLVLRTFGFIGPSLVYQFDSLTNGIVSDGLDFARVQTPAALVNTMVDTVVFWGAACNTSGSCSFGTTASQFAVDNITVSVPEPASLALIGLGLAGLVARRRSTPSTRLQTATAPRA